MSIPLGEVSRMPMPSRRRVLIAAPVSARVARLVRHGNAAVLRPELAAKPAGLADALVELRPHSLVVGANAVDGPTLARWAAAVGTDGPGTGDGRRLLLVRRGTSLAAVDTQAATDLGIEVRNTPEVNARHVARFIVERLLGPSPSPSHGHGHGRPGRLGLVGAGNINGRVARAAIERGWRVAVHSPSLAADPAGIAAWATAHRLPAGAVRMLRVVPTVEDVFDRADLVSVAVPLVHDGPRASAGLIDTRHLKLFAGRRIVSVSEPEVFTDRALVDAYARRDLEVVIDNAARFLDPVRRLLAARFAEDGGVPRTGFELCSAATRTAACDDDLDQAFLTMVGQFDLDDLVGADIHRPGAAGSPAPMSAPGEPRDGTGHDRRGPARAKDRRVDGDPAPDDPAIGGHSVVVVGGGIVGLTTALVLRLRGYERVTILDAAPADRTDPTAQGTTFGGSNGRHLSVTETLPQSDARRVDVLGRGPDEGGWRLRDPTTLTAPEVAWATAFEECTDRPGLHSLSRDLVIALNRLGLRGWENLFGHIAEDLHQVRRDARIPRVYLDPDERAAGELLQRSAGGRVVGLADADLRRDWPALGRSVPLPTGVRTVAGAVEVDGYAVNIHDLALALTARLAAAGVEVRAGARVDRLETDPVRAASPGTDAAVRLHLTDGSTVRCGAAVVTVAGRDLHHLLGGTWAGARSVAHLLGVSLTLPNPGLRRPVKIHAGDPLGVINVTLSADGSLIHVSGGFGYLGLAGAGDGSVVDGVDRLRAVLERAVAGLFPTLCRPDGSLDVREVRTCERPVTPDGMPLVDAPDRFAGRVVVAAGTNAGGTVQAPAVGLLVADLLAGAPRCAHLAMAGDRVSLPANPDMTPSASE